MSKVHTANGHTGLYWNEERVAQLRSVWFSGMSVEDMAALYEVTPDTILTLCCRRFKFGKRKFIGKVANNPEKIKFLTRNYPQISDQTLAVLLGVSQDCVRDNARRLGLRKTEQYLRESNDYRARKISETQHRRLSQSQ